MFLKVFLRCIRACWLLAPLGVAQAGVLASEPARAEGAAEQGSYDAVVQAVRQSVVAAQVPGAVVQLGVKAGDVVQAGQLLLRLDARSADQSAAAASAQVQAARAQLDVATREWERQKQLHAQKYISQAALDQAQGRYSTAAAQLNAQVAQAGAAHTQTGLHLVRAPYAAVVGEVPVALGDMAMPGRPLLTLYDPAHLRVTAAIPQSVWEAAAAAAAAPGAQADLRIELPGGAAPQWIKPTRVQVLPMVDAATHTVELRADLPPGAVGVRPGQFARLWLSGRVAGPSGAAPRITVVQKAIVRRAEMHGVYVLGADGKPQLRQVRLGRAQDGRVEVLSGVSAGENVVTEPQQVARVR